MTEKKTDTNKVALVVSDSPTYKDRVNKSFAGATMMKPVQTAQPVTQKGQPADASDKVEK